MNWMIPLEYEPLYGLRLFRLTTQKHCLLTLSYGFLIAADRQSLRNGGKCLECTSLMTEETIGSYSPRNWLPIRPWASARIQITLRACERMVWFFPGMEGTHGKNMAARESSITKSG